MMKSVLSSMIGLAIIIAGFACLLNYSTEPGLTGEVSQELNSLTLHDTEVRFGDYPDGCLMIFVHPKCPCTRATVRQFERMQAAILDRSPLKLAIVYQPDGNRPDWADTDIVRSLQRIPDLKLVYDDKSEIASRLGALTSGHVMFYDSRGELQFSGGLTPSRGHEGDCLAASELCRAVKQWPQTALSTRSKWPVYGCPFDQ